MADIDLARDGLSRVECYRRLLMPRPTRQRLVDILRAWFAWWWDR